MSLLKRNARPLTREVSDFRDDKLFIIACDDTFAPKQYFSFFNLNRVKIHVVSTDDGTSHAEHVLDRLMSYECEEYDERWMLLDTDHCIRGGHIRSFIRTLKDAEKKGVNVALSRSCFEVWLLLHHLEAKDVISTRNAAEVEELLRSTLGNYNKTRLMEEDFPLALVPEACRRAAALDAGVQGTHIPKSVTSRVYKLWLSIVNSASPQQLPRELHPLRNQ
jgi:hypothetical protein